MKQSYLPFEHELVVDLFAGGGGASEAMRLELGREPDIAINHDADAIAMHTANHPTTEHICEDVYDADPLAETRGRPVGLLHASPDCTDHSQAKGGQPRRKEIRSLCWVLLKWAGKVKPRCITLENVEQILAWGPLIAKRDPATGRVIKLDKTVAAPGERVPVREQFLVADPKRKGQSWRRLVNILRGMGYVVEWGKLRACDFGAGTTRERLFMMARRDGLPIVWPKPTHGKKRPLKPFVTAADCIDWSIKCPSIFDRETRRLKPLAEATHRRIARGIKRYVLDSADPFIVPVTHAGDDRVHPTSDPLRTITTAQRGEFMLCAPSLIQRSYGERPGQAPRVFDAQDPLSTLVAGGIKHAVTAAYLEQATNGGMLGRDARDPVSTIMSNGGSSRQRVLAAHLTKFRQNSIGSGIDEPVPTITAGGHMKRPAGSAHALGKVAAYLEQANTGMVGHDARDPLSTIVQKGCTQRVIAATLTNFHKSNTHGGRGDPREPTSAILAGGTHQALIECELSPESEAGALRVAAFLIRYYSSGGQWGDLRKPLDTITVRDRLALVTVTIRGVPYVIVDIGLRMLVPPELFAAQGFPRTYIIDHGIRGGQRVKLTKTAQVRMVGNSVSPPPYQALLRANFAHEQRYAAVA